MGIKSQNFAKKKTKKTPLQAYTGKDNKLRTQATEPEPQVGF